MKYKCYRCGYKCNIKDAYTFGGTCPVCKEGNLLKVNKTKHELRSTCCDALPIGEVSEDLLGFCSKCKDHACFENVEV